MANFWQAIIDKVTGHTDDDKALSSQTRSIQFIQSCGILYKHPPHPLPPLHLPYTPLPPLDISHVAASAAASSDPKVEAAKQAAAQGRSR